MRYLCAVLLALLTISCISSIKIYHIGLYTYTNKEHYSGHPIKEIPIWVDKDFGEADRLAIDNAVSQWNYSLNGYIVLKIVDYNFNMEIPKINEQQRKNGWLILKVDQYNSAVHDDPGRITCGTSDSDKGYLYLVRERLKNEDVEGVSMHEMGHLLSDPSHESAEGLMYSDYSQGMYQCVDFDAVARVAKKYEIPLKNLNFCHNGN